MPTARLVEASTTQPRTTVPAPSGAADPRRAGLLWLTAGVLVLALAAFVHLPKGAADLRSGAVAVATERAASRSSAWIPVAAPAPIFSLGAMPAPLTRYEARVEAESGAREDIATYGVVSGGFYLRVALIRADAPPPASHFVDLARRAADASLALSRLGRPEVLAARFDAVEVADAALAPAGTQALRACQSFRLRDAALGVGLAGWLCDDRIPGTSRATLACVIDRLALAPGEGDLALRAVFAAPRRALACPDLPPLAAVAESAPDPAPSTGRKRGRATTTRAPRASQS